MAGPSKSWHNLIIESDSPTQRAVSFFFYSADRQEPPHVHVEREMYRAKFWLDPVRLARSGRFGAAELAQIERLVVEHQQALLRAWNEYFSE